MLCMHAVMCTRQSLVAGMGDEVRLGRGFMFWGLTLSLTEEGLSHEALLLEAIYAAIKASTAGL